MRSLALLLPVLFAVVPACSSATEDEGAVTSDAAFTEGDYVQQNDPHFWAPSTFEEFQAASQTFGIAPQPTLAAEDPLTVRVQAWTDRVDAIVRREVERKSGRPLAAPKPIAKVLVSSQTFNAWVTPVPAYVGTAVGTRRDPGSALYLGRANVQAADGFTDASCLHPTTWSAEGLRKLWDSAKPPCALTKNGDTLSVTGSAACTFGPNAREGGERLVVGATGQYIQFTTDLLAEMDETALAVVIAHELGHYYRGHTTEMGAARFDFWYVRDAQQKKTPAPAKSSAELQAAYAEVVQGVKPAGGVPLPSKYSARLRPLLLAGIAPLLAERTEPDFVCAAARDALGAWTTELQTSDAPSEETRKSFVAFEAKLAKCAPALALAGDVGARSVSAGSVLFAGSMFRPGPKTKISITLGDDLGAFLGRLDVSARDLDAKAARLLKKMRDSQVGLYTVEQEADDFAMDLATKLGFSSEEVLGGWLSFMAASDRRLLKTNSPEVVAAYYASQGELDAAACGALMKDGFTKDDGSGHRLPVTLSLGDLTEPHHTSCYRLWNLARDASVHRFVAGAKPEALAPAWEELRTEAVALTASAPPPEPAAAAATQARIVR